MKSNFFDLSSYNAQCLISDDEWYSIFESNTHRKIGKYYHVVFKRHLLTFNIRNGNVEIVKQRRTPCKNYKLPPEESNVVNFQQRLAVWKEEERIAKGYELDDSNFLIYGT